MAMQSGISILRWLSVLVLAVGLAGCDGGRGCFGLCDESDDDEPPVSDDPDVNRSCYADSTLGVVEPLAYAGLDTTAPRRIAFQAIASATVQTPRPVLIWVTGATWASGNDPEQVPTLARRIARELGAHLAAVGYRSESTASFDATWPVPLQDVNGAVRFLKAQAPSLNIDPERMILAGDQAGAHLASLSAVATGIQEFAGDDNSSQSNRVAAALLFGGLYDFESLLADSESIESRCGALPSIAGAPVRALFDCAAPLPGESAFANCDAGELEQAGAGFHLSSDDPPLLLWHGALDCSIASQQSQSLASTLSSRNLDHELTILADDTEALESLTATDVEVALAGLLTCEE